MLKRIEKRNILGFKSRHFLLMNFMWSGFIIDIYKMNINSKKSVLNIKRFSNSCIFDYNYKSYTS